MLGLHRSSFSGSSLRVLTYLHFFAFIYSLSLFFTAATAFFGHEFKPCHCYTTADLIFWTLRPQYGMIPLFTIAKSCLCIGTQDYPLPTSRRFQWSYGEEGAFRAGVEWRERT